MHLTHTLSRDSCRGVLVLQQQQYLMNETLPFRSKNRDEVASRLVSICCVFHSFPVVVGRSVGRAVATREKVFLFIIAFAR